MAWRWIEGAQRHTLAEASEHLRSMVKGIRQYGVHGGPEVIEDPEPEVVVMSVRRHELLMDLLERHGGLEELRAAEEAQTPSQEDIERAAEELGITLESPARSR